MGKHQFKQLCGGLLVVLCNRQLSSTFKWQNYFKELGLKNLLGTGSKQGRILTGCHIPGSCRTHLIFIYLFCNSPCLWNGKTVTWQTIAPCSAWGKKESLPNGSEEKSIRHNTAMFCVALPFHVRRKQMCIMLDDASVAEKILKYSQKQSAQTWYCCEPTVW